MKKLIVGGIGFTGFILLMNELCLFWTILVGIGCIAGAVYLYKKWEFDEDEYI